MPNTRGKTVYYRIANKEYTLSKYCAAREITNSIDIRKIREYLKTVVRPSDTAERRGVYLENIVNCKVRLHEMMVQVRKLNCELSALLHIRDLLCPEEDQEIPDDLKLRTASSAYLEDAVHGYCSAMTSYAYWDTAYLALAKRTKLAEARRAASLALVKDWLEFINQHGKFNP